MKRFLRGALAAGAALVVLACLARPAVQRASCAESKPLPPLKVGTDAPRLEDGPAPAPQEPGKRRLVCYDCHANFQEEELARTHAVKDVTCITCHGESRAHCNDENNITAPDRMYAREAIAPACTPCHTTHDAPAQAVIERWKEHGLEKSDPKKVVCTDCHGAHRMRVRSVRWDKTTGKLLKGSAPAPAAKPAARPGAAKSTTPKRGR